MLTSGFRTNAALVAFVAALAAPGTSSAQVYDNGLPDGDSGNEMTEWIQANDFTLGQSYNVTGFRFWAVSLAPSAYLGQIAWRIHGNDAGAPDDDNVLFSGLSAAVPVDEGNLGFQGNTRLRFDIGTNFTLGAGTYWLSLHNGDYSNTSRREFYWETTDPNGTLGAHEDQAPFDDGGWFNLQREHAFQIFGQPSVSVPEPGTFALIALGVGGLAAVRRRQKA